MCFKSRLMARVAGEADGRLHPCRAALLKGTGQRCSYSHLCAWQRNFRGGRQCYWKTWCDACQRPGFNLSSIFWLPICTQLSLGHACCIWDAGDGGAGISEVLRTIEKKARIPSYLKRSLSGSLIYSGSNRMAFSTSVILWDFFNFF